MNKSSVMMEHTPRVFDNPVILAILRTVADDQHAMVQGSAALLIKDATAVQLELPLVCLDGHTDWLAAHSLYQEHKF